MNVIERDAARAAGSAIGEPDKPTAPEPTERRKLRPAAVVILLARTLASDRRWWSS